MSYHTLTSRPPTTISWGSGFELDLRGGGRGGQMSREVREQGGRRPSLRALPGAARGQPPSRALAPSLTEVYSVLITSEHNTTPTP